MSDAAPRQGPLSHLRVLDLSRVLAGPFATQNLADMGAEVIKVEKPGEGDDTRGWGPPFVKAGPGERGDSAYFLSANRNKKSITVDLASAEGQQLIRRLAERSDIVVENYKVGTLARYGLDDARLRTVNPRLVYCSITGFGQSGPYAPRPGYDFVFQGMGGLMSITGVPDGEAGAAPMKVGVAVADLVTALYATSAILAALEQRHVSGRGQYIDIALLDCLVSLTSYQALNWFVSGEVPQRLGNGHPNIVPYQVFACKGGHVILAVANDGQFRSFSRAVGKGEWADDPRFAAGAARSVNRKLLCGMVAELMLERTMHQWIALLEAHNVPCGPINNIDQVFDDPQVQHRGLRTNMQHPGGPISLLASPLRFADTPVRYELPPPLLGQHTEQVLQQLLGLGADDVAALRARRVV
ncbi:MAG TPA: CaiB/BaiF CoA-transferase family protein [Rubrivivax sp.]|nr:CaiB/BaiF CoA-transferase family protein [Rubrivivax sp.]